MWRPWCVCVRGFATNELEERHHVCLVHTAVKCCFKQTPRGGQISFDIQRRNPTNFYVCEINTDLTHVFQVDKGAFTRELRQYCSQVCHRYESADVGVVAKQPHHLDTAYRAKRFLPFWHVFTASNQRFSCTRSFIFSMCLGSYQSKGRGVCEPYLSGVRNVIKLTG